MEIVVSLVLLAIIVWSIVSAMRGVVPAHDVRGQSGVDEKRKSSVDHDHGSSHRAHDRGHDHGGSYGAGGYHGGDSNGL